jgi:hypothetical protein
VTIEGEPRQVILDRVSTINPLRLLNRTGSVKPYELAEVRRKLGTRFDDRMPALVGVARHLKPGDVVPMKTRHSKDDRLYVIVDNRARDFGLDRIQALPVPLCNSEWYDPDLRVRSFSPFQLKGVRPVGKVTAQGLQDLRGALAKRLSLPLGQQPA